MLTLRRLACATVVMLALQTAAQADIFMYRDARGGLHFSNAPTEAQYHFYRSEAEVWRPVRWTSGIGNRWVDPKRHKAYDALIREACERHQVDAALVKAVIHAESDFVPTAVSRAGALGLMQLMPGTARLRGVDSVFEPRQNIDGGVKHLRYLLDRYNGNLRLAIAAYNAGEKAVDRFGGVPPFQETWGYLARVMRFRDRYLQEPLASSK